MATVKADFWECVPVCEIGGRRGCQGQLRGSGFNGWTAGVSRNFDEADCGEPWSWIRVSDWPVRLAVWAGGRMQEAAVPWRGSGQRYALWSSQHADALPSRMTEGVTEEAVTKQNECECGS